MGRRREISVRDCGAVGDGQKLNTNIIQRALDDCAGAGGGTVVIPAGCFVSGPLRLGPHTTLQLESGAVLLAAGDISTWPVIEDSYAGDADEREVYQPFLYAKDVENIGIVGAGVIDGGGDVWWSTAGARALRHRRPRLFAPSGCRNVRVAGVTLMNSPQWTVNPVCCESVTITGVTVRNPPSPNTDGINPDSCRDVTIENCVIDTGDDCIAIKAGTERSLRPPERAVCENIRICGCTMLRGHGGVVCGSEMSGGIRNVSVSECTFRGTERGLRFKSRRGRGGLIENFEAADIIMEDVPAPFVASSLYNCYLGVNWKADDMRPFPVDHSTPIMRGLRFRRIEVRGAEYAAGVFHGLPEMPIQDVVMEHVRVAIKPDAREGETAMTNMISRMRKRAWFLRHVNGVRFLDVEVAGFEGPWCDAAECEAMEMPDGQMGR